MRRARCSAGRSRRPPRTAPSTGSARARRSSRGRRPTRTVPRSISPCACRCGRPRNERSSRTRESCVNLDRRQICGLLAGAALLPALRVARAEPTPPSEALVAAATKEGKAGLYTATMGEPYHREIGKAFEKRYGVRVETLEARASEVRERIRVEQVAGHPAADLSFNGATTTKLQPDDGTFEPHGELPNTALLLDAFPADGVRLPVRVMLSGWLVNTRLVPPAD